MEFPSPTVSDASLEALEAQITEVWDHINSATYRFLELLAEFDRTRGWARHGLANCTQWLHWQCGIGPCSAREKVRVARALAALPKISDAFRQGRVSYSKVRAMTRVATPENEDTLLNVALHGTATQVERTVRKFKRVRREMERRGAEEVHQARSVQWWAEGDGSWRLYAHLSPEVAAVVGQAIDAAMAAVDELKEGARSDGVRGPNGQEPAGAMNESGEAMADGAMYAGGWTADVSAETSAADSVGEVGSRGATSGAATSGAATSGAATSRARPSLGARRADALRHMAEQFLAHQADVTGSSAERYQVVVHIGEDALRESGEALGGAELEQGPERGRELAVETARRLGCGGSLIGMVDGSDGEPLNVGRKTRAVPTAIQRALRSRDGGCRFPGCDRNRFTQAHHIRHWADGGETSLGNLVTLCHFHHRLVHEGGYSVHAADNAIGFTRPDGRAIPASGWDSSRAAGRPNSCFRGNIRVERDAESGEPDKFPLVAYNDRRGVTVGAEAARCG